MLTCVWTCAFCCRQRTALTVNLAAMSEKAPLLHYRLTASLCPEQKDISKHGGTQRFGDDRRAKGKSTRKLGAVFGVVIPTLLSMFSVVVFLRIGKWDENKKCYICPKINKIINVFFLAKDRNKINLLIGSDHFIWTRWAGNWVIQLSMRWQIC